MSFMIAAADLSASSSNSMYFILLEKAIAVVRAVTPCRPERIVYILESTSMRSLEMLTTLSLLVKSDLKSKRCDGSICTMLSLSVIAAGNPSNKAAMKVKGEVHDINARWSGNGPLYLELATLPDLFNDSFLASTARSSKTDSVGNRSCANRGFFFSSFVASSHFSSFMKRSNEFRVFQSNDGGGAEVVFPRFSDDAICFSSIHL